MVIKIKLLSVFNFYKYFVMNELCKWFILKMNNVKTNANCLIIFDRLQFQG